MVAQLQPLTYSTRGVLTFYVTTYGVALVALLAGLLQGRAHWSKLLQSPLTALLVMLLGMFVTNLIDPLRRRVDIEVASVVPFILRLAIVAAVGYFAGRLIARRSTLGAAPQYRRGAVVNHAKRGSRSPRDTQASLAGIPVPLEDETKHFKLIGTTGTGKSTAISEILGKVLARGDRAIIADPDGGYMRRFYDPSRGDVILNPFHPGALKWDLFAEIFNEHDVDQLARSLIPDSGDPERIWCDYARTVFAAIVRQSIAADSRDDLELFKLITTAPVEELRMMLEATAASPFLAEGNERMFGSVRSVASSALKALEYTTKQQAAPFSVRQWVRQGNARHAGGKGGVLFIPYKAGEIAALRSVISAWMRLGVFEAMDREEGDQRLWFVVDELDALGEIDGLKDALARLRKFGGRCVLGFQSIAQVSGTYGRGAAETIVENCANTLILRCSASEHGGTSEFASKLIGQREVLHTTLSRTRRQMQLFASNTSSQHLKIEPAVMASEIERLPDLTGFLKLASTPDWMRVALTPGNERSAPRLWRGIRALLTRTAGPATRSAP